MQTESGYKRVAKRAGAKVKEFFRHPVKTVGGCFDRRPVVSTVALSFLVTLVIEMASRHSPLDGIAFIFTHPIHFAANMLIVLMTLSPAHFLKKRAFFLTLISVVWMGLGITNAIVLANRVTPFGAIDIAVLPSVLPIINMYLDTWQLILLGIAILAVIVLLIVLFIKCPKRAPRFRMAAIFLAASVLLAAGAYSVTVVGQTEKRQHNFANIADAYKTYGFVYCFCTGALDQGIHEPDFYSRASVNWLVGNLKDSPAPEVRPNIIMIQLESFFDVSYLDDIDYDDDPIPVFTSLKDSCSSGFLTVPSVGAGTANTEFEVLSGMSLDFFGMGEYPYKTILKEEACESAVRDLHELGYTGTAIHNNTGTFYGRDEVFAQLGFDYFTSIEYMEHVEYNPIGWCKDQVLVEEILKALDATQNQDFIFTITVQGHGKYQRGIDSVDMEHLNVTWADEDQDEDSGPAFAYYVDQLSQTDAVIGQLLDALNHRAEPTVVVLYGDHLPSFDIGSDELANGDIFQTEYVIWSNYGLPERDEDLSAYQLTSRVFSDLGISSGLLTKYHQQMSDTADYIDGLKLLEYDMLYGDYYCYGGSNPYTATDLVMGVEPVLIAGYEYDGQTLTVHGRQFTSFSVVALDGDELETEFVDGGTLRAVLEEAPESGQVLTVRQDTKRGTALSESVGVIVE